MSASAEKEAFDFTGDEQAFTVPSDICRATIYGFFGAQGGQGRGTIGDTEGLGGRATSAIEVTPGETLVVYVGGAGEPGMRRASRAPAPRSQGLQPAEEMVGAP